MKLFTSLLLFSSLIISCGQPKDQPEEVTAHQIPSGFYHTVEGDYTHLLTIDGDRYFYEGYKKVDYPNGIRYFYIAKRGDIKFDIVFSSGAKQFFFHRDIDKCYPEFLHRKQVIFYQDGTFRVSGGEYSFWHKIPNREFASVPSPFHQSVKDTCEINYDTYL